MTLGELGYPHVLTDATCDTVEDSKIVAHNLNPSIVKGLFVSGTGIPSNTYI